MENNFFDNNKFVGIKVPLSKPEYRKSYNLLNAVNLIGLVFLGISTLIFYFILKWNVPTDIQLHSKILSKYLIVGSFPNPPLYYFSIYVLNLIFENNFFFASITVLSTACFLKYLYVAKYIQVDSAYKNKLVPAFAALSLMFIGAIHIGRFDEGYLYLGKFTSAIWHNSTTIFVFPFCVWLFLQSLSFIKEPSFRKSLQILGIGLIILLAKPSFLFPFIVMFPLIYLYNVGRINRWAILLFIICSLLFSMIILQKVLIYKFNPLDNLIYHGEASRVVIAPFEVWLSWAKNPVNNIWTSFGFIIVFIALRFSTITKDLELIFALGLLFISLLIFFLLAESGPRMQHGNFFWQVPISIFITHMVMLKRMVTPSISASKVKTTIMQHTDKILLSVYCLHLISGLYYILKIFRSSSVY